MGLGAWIRAEVKDANEAKAKGKCGVEDEHIYENAHNLKPFCLNRTSASTLNI